MICSKRSSTASIERRRSRYNCSNSSICCWESLGYCCNHCGLSKTSSSSKFRGLGSGVSEKAPLWRSATAGGVCGAWVPTTAKKGSGFSELLRMKSLASAANTSVELPVIVYVGKVRTAVQDEPLVPARRYVQFAVPIAIHILPDVAGSVPGALKPGGYSRLVQAQVPKLLFAASFLRDVAEYGVVVGILAP